MKSVALRHSATVLAGQAPSGDAVHPIADGIEGIPFIQGNAEFGVRSPTPRLVAVDPPKVAPSGSILLSVRAPVGALNIASETIAIGRGVVALVPRNNGLHPRFLWWCMHALIPRLRSMATGSTYEAVDASDIKSLPLPALDYRSQISAAHFLDRECERIAAIEIKTTSLDRLKVEAYERLLRDAVGTERHDWVQIRRAATTGTGHTPSRTHPEWWISDECVVPWFTLADVHQIRGDTKERVSTTAEMISPVGVANSSAVVHPKETVLLSRTASVGFSAVMDVDMAVSQDFMTWTCGPRLMPDFLLYALRAIRPELRGMMYGSTHKTIYMPDLLALKIPLPELEEQVWAVATVRAGVARHWDLRDRTTSLRARLAEYRDALITEAVTGQLDIPAMSESRMDERAHAAFEGASAA